MKQLCKYTFLDRKDNREWSVYGPAGETPNPKDRIGSLGDYVLQRVEPAIFVHEHFARAMCHALSLLPSAGGKWLPEVLHCDNPDNPVYLVRIKDGLKVYFSIRGYRQEDKVTFGYSRPNNRKRNRVEVYDEKNNRLSDPSINVSEKKTPDEMARDITRRLLPDAFRVHTAVLARIAADDAAEDRQKESRRAVAQMLGIPEPEGDRMEFGFRAGGEQSVRINCSGSVDLKLYSLNLKQAAAVLEALKGATK